MSYSLPVTAQVQHQPMKIGLLLLILPVLVIILMIVFWVIFQNTRHNNSMESYQAEIADKVRSKVVVNTVTPQLPLETITSKAVDFNQSVSIQSQVAGVTSNGGKYWILGLRNQSELNLSRPGVMLSLFNQDGQRIEEQGGWSLRENLQPGEETVVLLYLDKQPDGVVDQKITAFASKPSQLGSRQQEVAVQSFTVNQKNNHYEIIGDVINNQSQLVKYIRLMVVAYDADEKPVGIGNAFSTVKELAPEKESGFKVRVGTFLVGEPHSWKVWALGRQ